MNLLLEVVWGIVFFAVVLYVLWLIVAGAAHALAWAETKRYNRSIGRALAPVERTEVMNTRRATMV